MTHSKTTRQRILFLCHGNICRSPMAEFVMRHIVAEAGRGDDFEIDSAAVSSEEIGNDMYPAAKACLRRHGVPFSRRAARRVTRADYDRFDRIFVMDRSNLRLLAHAGIADTAGKVSMLMELAGSGRDVADPWYTGDFERTYNDLCEALPRILDF